MTIGEADWMTLNAYADGELAAQDVVALNKRLRQEPELAGELARIREAKTALAGLRPTAPPVPVAAPKRRSPVWSLAASFTLLLAVGFAAYGLLSTQSEPQVQLTTSAAQPAKVEPMVGTAVALPATAGGIKAPDLTASNLILIEMSLQGDARGHRVSMEYRGPNGCRVTLVARPPGAEPLPEAAALQARWQTPRAHYLLSAEGMDRQRFAAIADYAEAQVRAEEQEALRLALIDTTAEAAPCA